MNHPVTIVPTISLSNWYRDDSCKKVEEQIVNALIEEFTPENLISYFDSSLNDIPNPSLLKNIDDAVDLLLDTIRKKERTLIVGDYDVDGITSTALLIRFFKKIAYTQFETFLPNRFIHGYGLTDKTVEVILLQKPDLVLTVDNGITARAEINRIQEAGIKVIVTDHHLPQQGFLPDCLILNPRQENCKFPFKELAGVGVVFLFLISLRAELRKRGFWKDDKTEINLLEYLDLVAIGTVADQVPLLGLNRIFTKFGLNQMTKKNQEGYPGEFYHYLKAFSAKTGIKFFNSDSISFNLAPMLNATGRMEEAMEGLRFIMVEDEQSALSRYQNIERINQKRKKKQQTMIKKAEQKAEAFIKKGLGIVVYDESFHEGLIGIIASRLVDQFFYPAIVVTDSDPGILKASCRSKEVNIMEILQECSELLIQFGGHKNAAGCSLKKENFGKFHEKYTEICNRMLSNENTMIVKANIEVEQEMLTYSLINELRILEPYGQDNRKPTFFIKNIRLPSPTVLTGKHLKWTLEQDLELLFWNGAGSFSHAASYNVAFTLSENVFRGERKRQMVVSAIAAWQETN
ncbi:single-stranded-DNA-specific exonuclease RecJ [bacterium]|nr:single-stranded-DNA-specific exonuclease RecJ [bacterium]